MSLTTDERSTPQELFDELNNEFHFTVDVCAADNNYKCARYFSFQLDGLGQSWEDERAWMNPPYSDIKNWLYKAVNSKAEVVVCILPMDGSTHWFHRFIWDKSIHAPRPGVQIRYPDKRYKFNNSNSAKFATLVVVIKPSR